MQQGAWAELRRPLSPARRSWGLLCEGCCRRRSHPRGCVAHWPRVGRAIASTFHTLAAECVRFCSLRPVDRQRVCIEDTGLAGLALLVDDHRDAMVHVRGRRAQGIGVSRCKSAVSFAYDEGESMSAAQPVVTSKGRCYYQVSGRQISFRQPMQRRPPSRLLHRILGRLL
jgi:hypothetical protein